MSKTKKEIFEELLAKEPTEENVLKSVDFALKYMHYNKFRIKTRSESSKDFYTMLGIVIFIGLLSVLMFIYLYLNQELIKNINYLLITGIMFHLFISNIFSVFDSKPIKHFQVYKQIQDNINLSKKEENRKENENKLNELIKEYL